MSFDSGLASAFLIPYEEFIPNYADETFPSTNIPDGGNVQRTGSGSSGLPRQSFNSAFQGHKGSSAYIKSLCTSFHNLANNFDYETFEDITSDAILDGELVKVDVKWLKSRHDELNKVVNQIKEYKKLKLFRRSNMKAIESKRSTLNCKKVELLKLQSQVESLENRISLLSAETESLGDDLSRAKQDFERFQRTSLMDGLL
ncbi:hypothetical protein PanWU01x14_037010 [Parasponia andersonii]|uniref:Uncharacterized protein n=1 Tax=Parasponia andersonii TaxID=3476 RepID=A0A2P5DSL0_PARAD|nr:hypothetical protein PanWU01x14_037010 [Parasponia andersonii]